MSVQHLQVIVTKIVKLIAVLHKASSLRDRKL